MPALVDTPRRYRPTLPGTIPVVGISRNRWSLSPGLGGRFPPESVVAFGRATQLSPLPIHLTNLSRSF